MLGTFGKNPLVIQQLLVQKKKEKINKDRHKKKKQHQAKIISRLDY